MKNTIIAIFFVVLLSLSACDKGTLDKFDVVYEVEFVGAWSAASHPTDFPSNAHFSPMVILSHLQGVEIFTEGLSTGAGMIAMAETGATGTLDDEYQVLINTSLGLDKNIGESFDSPGTNEAIIGVGIGYSTVTVVSMIAPSPDWFVSATTNLIDPTDGAWFDEVTIDVSTYDAGSDEGTTFTSPDMPLDTLQGVSAITTGPLVEGGTVVENMGQFIFRRVQ